MSPTEPNRLPLERAIPISKVGLIAMDMDSTAITIECIDEIADFAGLKNEVAAITAAAMRGELDFKESLRRRVACLRGLPVEVLHQVYESRLKPAPGLAELMRYANDHGVKTLLISGGFTYFTERMRTRFGYTYTRANTLGRSLRRYRGFGREGAHAAFSCQHASARAQRNGRPRRRCQRFTDAARGNARRRLSREAKGSRTSTGGNQRRRTRSIVAVTAKDLERLSTTR
jgi:HAD superfamily phosphoserine phosphatase-like hydrolase